jgi:hypothetical protein
MRYKSVQRDKPYCGRVLDGPFEGEWVEEETQFFLGQYVLPSSSISYGPGTPSSSVEVHQFVYKWLSSYRAWVWVQSGRFV